MKLKVLTNFRYETWQYKHQSTSVITYTYRHFLQLSYIFRIVMMHKNVNLCVCWPWGSGSYIIIIWEVYNFLTWPQKLLISRGGILKIFVASHLTFCTHGYHIRIRSLFSPSEFFSVTHVCGSESLFLSVDQLRLIFVTKLTRDLLEQGIISCLLNASRKIPYALDVCPRGLYRFSARDTSIFIRWTCFPKTATPS
jgi:hypothetical protein